MGLFTGSTKSYSQTQSTSFAKAGAKETNLLDTLLNTSTRQLQGMEGIMQGGWNQTMQDVLGDFWRQINTASKKAVGIGSASGLNSSITGNYFAQLSSAVTPMLTSLYTKRLDMPFQAISAMSSLQGPMYDALTGYFQRERLAGATTKTKGKEKSAGISLSFS